MERKITDRYEGSLAVVIMAAGKGTRMRDPTKVKVMYDVLGKPMLYYVVNLAKILSASRIIVIVGYQRDTVIDYLKRACPLVEIAVQSEQLGTGHAVMQAEKLLENFVGDIIVLSGDVPLLTADTLKKLVEYHHQTSASATILTADFEDPSGYGRIVLNSDGSVKKIIEHKDATEEERRITEINSGIYMFDKSKLFESLKHIIPKNVQNEYYLTDVFEYFWKNSWKVFALKTTRIEEIMGVNTVDQLEEVQQIILKRRTGDTAL